VVKCGHVIEWYESMVQKLGSNGMYGCGYAWIFMVMVVMHEVMVCS